MALGLGISYNLIILSLLFVGWYPDWMSIIAAIMDTALAVTLMWFTGGFESGQMPVLLFVVVTVALRHRPETGLLSATPMVLAYGVSIILSGTTDVNILIDISIKALTLFITAGVVGYVSRRQSYLITQDNREEIKNLRITAERAKAIYEMANTVNSTLNYRKVLKSMVDFAYMALAEVDNPQNGQTISQDQGAVGLVLLFEGDGPQSKLTMAAGRNVPKIDEGRKVLGDEGILAQVIYKAEAVVINNLQNDAVLQQFAALQKCHSMVCAPLRAGFDTWGLVLIANPRHNYYTSVHASFLATFCNQAIVALQNAQLYADLELEQKKLLEKEAQARHELARNLHDGPTQDVAGLTMRLNFVKKLLQKGEELDKALEEVIQLEEIAQKTTQKLRTTLFTLRPVVLETQGLGAALDQYAERLRNLEGLNIDIENYGYEGQLSTEAEGVVFNIVEEAIGNVKKHTDANQVQIKLGVHHNAVIAEVKDNGQGFDVSATEANYDQRGSLGLINMKERARMIGGHCHLISAIGQGTSVRVEVPIDKNGKL